MSTAEVLSRGMECLLEKMDVVEVERFVFLLRADQFDYTRWQREHYSGISQERLEKEMEMYFSSHPYTGDPKKVI